jgi:hypothetical protein
MTSTSEPEKFLRVYEKTSFPSEVFPKDFFDIKAISMSLS